MEVLQSVIQMIREVFRVENIDPFDCRMLAVVPTRDSVEIPKIIVNVMAV
jgi:hypothetical protein